MLADGNAAGARRHFEKAIRSWNEIGAPYETAIARLELADVQRAAGQLDSANIEAEAARDVLQRIGAAAPRARRCTATTGDVAPAPSPAAIAYRPDPRLSISWVLDD